jgi:hypothetical protein
MEEQMERDAMPEVGDTANVFADLPRPRGALSVAEVIATSRRLSGTVPTIVLEGREYKAWTGTVVREPRDVETW